MNTWTKISKHQQNYKVIILVVTTIGNVMLSSLPTLLVSALLVSRDTRATGPQRGSWKRLPLLVRSCTMVQNSISGGTSMVNGPNDNAQTNEDHDQAPDCGQAVGVGLS